MNSAWQTALLDDLVEHDSPITYGVVKPGDPGDVPFVRGGDIADGKLRETQLRTITSAVSQQYKRTLLRGGELLVSLVGQPGQVAVAPTSLAGSNIARQVGLIRLQTSVDAQFVCHFLRSPDGIEGLRKFTGGSVQQVINLSDLRQVVVPVPPLNEQRRIVTLLDEAFEGIATAKAHAEKNLRNALDMFASHLYACLVQTGADSVETVLGAEVNLLAGYAFSSTGYTNDTDGIRLLRGDNIMQGYLRWDEVKRWPAVDADAHQRFALQQGDVVLAMDRPWVKAGLKRAQISGDDLPCLQVQRTARLRPLPTLRSDFLYYLTGSRAFSQHLLAAQTGIGVPHISGKQIEGFAFHRPPVEEQARLAQKLRMVEEQCQKLASLYQRKLTALAELQQSLLHQAFTGQL